MRRSHWLIALAWTMLAGCSGGDSADVTARDGSVRRGDAAHRRDSGTATEAGYRFVDAGLDVDAALDLPDAGVDAARPDEHCWASSPADYSDRGPYETGTYELSVENVGPFTLFVPLPLDDDCPHPIVAWGNGYSVTGSNVYSFYQRHAASWGLVVIASEEGDTTSGADHRGAIDFLARQNQDPNSQLFSLLTMRAGVAGHSFGGLGANRASSHPLVRAEVNIQGAFGDEPRNLPFLCLTGTNDFSVTLCRDAVAQSSAPAVYANWEGADHFSTPTLSGYLARDEGSYQYRRLYTAWFRCYLAEDPRACALFQGDCPICQDQGWRSVERNNLP